MACPPLYLALQSVYARKLSRPLPATPSKLDVEPREDLRKFPWFREISRADAECEVAIGLYQNYFVTVTD